MSWQQPTGSCWASPLARQCGAAVCVAWSRCHHPLHPSRKQQELEPLAVMASAVPPNFSWVVPDKLAGLAMPRLPAHYQYMHEHGIRHLVSLSERSPPYHDTCPGIQVHRLRIPDFCPPSVEQIQCFLQIVEDANAKGEAVAVHCLLGFGRTGTLLACYLVKAKKITGVDAIHEIRRIRPGAIETHEQEKAVIQFHHRIK
ncbi:dual specificity protein phosphatase 23 isoform X1 [Alligator sinensis]|uniref:Dual specificity protein phosphatase 23 n=2 Tax=Alligator sinensis TaxID=38654 RepID=A0A3Q0H4D3_ALLSI|nr:dual specificity protein phosphatase 23 isoform X1 [Alligator sinensis]